MAGPKYIILSAVLLIDPYCDCITYIQQLHHHLSTSMEESFEM